MHQQVKDWMTTDIITAEMDMPLPDAHELMKKHNIRRLPVVDKHHKLVGIVTRGDIRGARPSQASSLSIWEMNYLLAKLQLKDFMTRNPVTVNPETPIGEVARFMLDQKISGIPVVAADGKLAGIITESDLFRVMVRQWEEEQTRETAS
ncbi:MAG: CBS domain-containing protein [Anaerolineales bacterium]|nr:CBS domain-containing protein [Anaerolineales bacterium]